MDIEELKQILKRKLELCYKIISYLLAPIGLPLGILQEIAGLFCGATFGFRDLIYNYFAKKITLRLARRYIKELSLSALYSKDSICPFNLRLKHLEKETDAL